MKLFKYELKIQRIAAYRNEMSAIVSSSDFDYPTTPDDRYYTGFAFGDNGSSEKVIEEMKYAIEYINNIIVLREKTQTAITPFTSTMSFLPLFR